MTLAEFLLARIGEDEADYLLATRPHRVLAECEAKRRIVELHQPTPVVDHSEYECTCGFENHRVAWCAGCGARTFDEGDCERLYGPCPTLRLLALPYADHPDFREEWKP